VRRKEIEERGRKRPGEGYRISECGPIAGSWDGGVIIKENGCGKVDMKERILMTRMEYSVLKKRMK
jgi:hypothetical protein